MFRKGDLSLFKFYPLNGGYSLWKVVYKSERGKDTWVCLMDNEYLIRKTYLAGKNAMAKDIKALRDFLVDKGTCYDKRGREKRSVQKNAGRRPGSVNQKKKE